MSLRVYLTTWCKDEAQLYGTLLTFKTLRVGFPNAAIYVIDNGSLSSVTPIIEQHAKDAGAAWVSIPPESEVRHDQIIQSVVMGGRGDGPAVFIDPDLIFWSDVSAWAFPSEALVAGREIPGFHDPYTKTYTHRRLHTSFIWLPRPQALREEILAIRSRYFEWEPFRPAMFRRGDSWERLDTMSSLCRAMPETKTNKFASEYLNGYDHIFCGTHFSSVAEHIPEPFREQCRKVHRLAQGIGDLSDLKGIWRDQDEFFAAFAEANGSVDLNERRAA